MPTAALPGAVPARLWLMSVLTRSAVAFPSLSWPRGVGIACQVPDFLSASLPPLLPRQKTHKALLEKRGLLACTSESTRIRSVGSCGSDLDGAWHW
eukprot:855019-Rhodomonas_salina.1